MKVLQVILTYYPATRYGGPVQSVRNLARGLRACDVHSSICTTDNDGFGTRLDVPLDAPGMVDDAEVHYFRNPCFHRHGFSPNMARWLRGHVSGFDLVHIHGLWNFPERYAAQACRQAGVPYVISARGMLKRDVVRRRRPTWKYLYMHTLDRANVARAACIHYTTAAEQDASLHPSDGPGWVIPNAVDIEILPNAVDRKAARFKEYLLFVGRLCWIKNIDSLIRAFAALDREFPELGLVIAGPDEEGLQEGFVRLTARLGVQDRVKFPGLVAGERLAGLYRGASVFVLPSFSENFGHSVVEALGYGVPVLAADGVDVASLPELGVCVRRCPGRAPDMAAALREMLKALPDWRQRAAEGPALVRRLFSPEAIGRQMRTLYERIVATR